MIKEGKLSRDLFTYFFKDPKKKKKVGELFLENEIMKGWSRSFEEQIDANPWVIERLAEHGATTDIDGGSVYII